MEMPEAVTPSESSALITDKDGEERTGKSSAEASPEEPEECSFWCSGSGLNLPVLQNVQWADNSRGGIEAWHSPDGAQFRRERTYLGYAGKGVLAAWSALAPDECRAAVIAWIAEKRAAKGIG